jgi:SRSO17 transposase
MKYYLSNAPATMTLADMAWVGYLRWTIEENFELAKGEVGLDHYEVTTFQTDYLFASKPMAARLISCEALTGDEWFAVSDHAPIVADFE